MGHALVSELDGSTFRLEISGYEFPELQTDKYEANWIMVRLVIHSQKGDWTKTAPALLTWEIEDLIEWCRGRYEIEPLLQFVDPSIEFHATIVNTALTNLKLTLSGQLLPDWHDGGSITLEFFVSPAELKKFATELDFELSKFPYRQTIE
jgi:hypothetical protein